MNVFVALLIELLVSAAVLGYETTAYPLDPIYDTCTQARANGFGPYESSDPEYPHYHDGDNDGQVCEGSSYGGSSRP